MRARAHEPLGTSGGFPAIGKQPNNLFPTQVQAKENEEQQLILRWDGVLYAERALPFSLSNALRTALLAAVDFFVFVDVGFAAFGCSSGRVTAMGCRFTITTMGTCDACSDRQRR